MLFQNSIGIDVQQEKITFGWLKGEFKGLILKAYESHERNPDGQNGEGLSRIDTQLADFISRHSIDSFDLYMGISREKCLETEIELPFSVRDEIASVLQYELEKYIPMSASDVSYGYHVVREDKAADKVYVRIQVLKNEDLKPFIELKNFIPGGITGIVMTSDAADAYNTHLKSAKRSKIIKGIDPENDTSPDQLRVAALAFQKFDAGARQINFLPERFRKKPSKLPLIVFGSLLALTTISLLILTASFFVQAQIQNRQVESRLGLLKKQMLRYEVLEAKVTGLSRRSHEIQSVMKERDSMLDFLTELTRLTPEDTSIKEFEFRKQGIRIKGNSANATRLLAIFESSDFFSNVGFESKINIKDNQQETFVIKMAVESNHEK